MSVETDEDRLSFLSPDEFGGKALYYPREEDGREPIEPYEVAGIFDEPYTSFDPNRWPGHNYQMQQGAHFSSSAPRFECRANDLVKGGKKRDRLTVNGERYRINDVKRDGTGMVVLILMADGDAPKKSNTSSNL